MKYTVRQFADAIPESGGSISAIARKIGCDWHTARRYIERHATLRQAFEDEENRITDLALEALTGNLESKNDIALAKWWLRYRHVDFMPAQRIEHTGADKGPINVGLPLITLLDVLPKDMREQVEANLRESLQADGYDV